MAGRAVVRRILRLAYGKREATVCVRMATETFLSKIAGRLCGFAVWVMAA